ncbi:P-loop containing nucleoside triphosphate hydrolase protein [Testicularia cyperi]|uniref:DNA 3'-5' helicase n=1 Tax=Testicularia cyperi TaxID=1882483 RepID=A0A317XPD3_9BASI|nr:P-loop containing nucleoside triphosphate hydrolase protein [Testicularia cyperi]
MIPTPAVAVASTSAAAFTTPSRPAKRTDPPASSSSSFVAHSRSIKKKVNSTNDDSLAARLQPKLTSSSWRRTKSYQHVDLSGPTRRTVLEWLPREVVFMVIGLLGFPDIQNLLRADRRIRAFVHSKTFAPWRKRLACFQHKERLYDDAIALGEDAMFEAGAGDDHDLPSSSPDEHLDHQQHQQNTKNGNGTGRDQGRRDMEQAETAFLTEYTDVLRSLQLRTAPLDLTELLPCVTRVWHEHRSFAVLRKWCRDFALCKADAMALLSLVDDSTAIEFLAFVRLYLATVRISRAFGSLLPPLQVVRCLDYDCRCATLAFFAPARVTSGDVPFRLTEEQTRFVHCDVRPGELVKVQAFAGTGKTRSLLAYAERRPQKRFLYIAFNVSAANSARARFPSNVDCRTMHSVALRQVVLNAGQEIGDLRARDVIKLLGERLPEGQMLRAQSMATQTGRDPKLTPTAVATYVLATLQRYFYSDDAHITPDKHVPSKVAIDTDLKVRSVARCAQDLWDLIRSGVDERTNKPVRCPHDGYVKLLQLQAPHHSENFFKAFDVLLLDEAQDLSAAQVSILLRAKKHCGILVVGDVFQKIYGFRGGTARAFNERLYPSTASFQLTKSFRFGDAVARIATEMLALRKPAAWEKPTRKPMLSGASGSSDRVYAEARAILPRNSTSQGDPDHDAAEEQDQAAADAAPASTQAAVGEEGRRAIAIEAGSVLNIGRSEEILAHTRIFRSNRKLCLTALALSATLPEPHKMFLKTSQSLQPEAIVTLLRDAHILYHNDSRSMSRNSLLRDFASWKDLVQRVEAEGGGESRLSLAVALGSLFASSDFLDQVARLETRFSRSESEATVVLTTVHQAKGLEWDRVVVEDDFRPVFGAGPSKRLEVAGLWHQDELNHLYVGLTRAKKQLIVSRPVLQWIAAIRGLYQYRLSSKPELCYQCQSSKNVVVVKELRIEAFDFLDPRCNESVSDRTTTGSTRDNPVSFASDASSSTCNRASIHSDAIGDPDLVTFVLSAPKIAKQRPKDDNATNLKAKAKITANPTFTATSNTKVKVDLSKHAFLSTDHRAMKWAMMHHEYSQAVHSWL